MKILSLLLLLISTQAFAYDWQYSVKGPDGKIETKNIDDSEKFSFQAGDQLCSVSEDEKYEGQFKIKCTNGKYLEGGMTKAEDGEEFRRHTESVKDSKGKFYEVEILIYGHLAKKDREPFSDDAWTKDLD